MGPGDRTDVADVVVRLAAAPWSHPALRRWWAPLARPVARRVLHAAVGRPPAARPRGLVAERYDTPAGDPGLFGPGSVVWQVHGSPVTLVGGFSALMLQTLHPLTLAGVVQHSRYREDPLGRLARTSSFVQGTTFGGRQVAGELVGIVRGIHDRVSGIAPDGRPYSANDPELLRWVHVTEVDSFLRAYQRYAPRRLSAPEADRYLAESRRVAELLGARDLPASTGEVREYYQGLRDELAVTPQTRELLDFLCQPPVAVPGVAAVYPLVVRAAQDLLPGWARELLDWQRHPAETLAVRAAARALLDTLALVGENPAARAAGRRVSTASGAAATP